MSVLAPLPPVANIRPLWDAEEPAFAFGLEGRQLRERIHQVARHWHASAVQAAVARTQVEPQYRHVPLEKVKTIRVRYLPAKPLPPRRFDLEDLDEE